MQLRPSSYIRKPAFGGSFILKIMLLGLTMVVMGSCARMGQPDGGWYDETPPQVVSTSPEDRGVNVKSKKIYINFSEYVKIDNATENVVVSPPQLETPEIKAQGKRIVVELKDTLKPNTTYTVDFSDAISDNNEGNPLGNYTYTFSTGEQIDTMEVSGYVLAAEDLEPVQGILVGLYSNLNDSVFKKEPMLRVSKTDDTGHFTIKGVAPGNYRVYALKDADGNFIFSQKSEQIAFNHDVVVPSSKPDIRQDTLWTDSLHINSIKRISYTHFLPDDIVLRAFTEVLTDRYFLKAERKEANHFTIFFSYGDDKLPVLKGLNFNDENAFLVESSEKKDTITYWLRDSTLINQDTLRVQIQYQMTDSMGKLVPQTDTLELLSKQPYAKRLKEKNRRIAEWQKRQEKAKKRGDPVEDRMPVTPLVFKMQDVNTMEPDRNLHITFDTPLAKIDTAKIHLYCKIDTLWYRSRFQFRKVEDAPREYEVRGEWKPGIEYSLEFDSLAFSDIYGSVSNPMKLGFKIGSVDDYGSLFVTLTGFESKHVIGQLLSQQDKVVKEAFTSEGNLQFFYIEPGTYFLRIIEDDNNNGKWDTGNYDEGLQPEAVYYYPEQLECKEKWDVSRTWNPTGKPLYNQKASVLKKKQATKKRTIKNQNAQRAKKLGIEYIPK